RAGCRHLEGTDLRALPVQAGAARVAARGRGGGGLRAPRGERRDRRARRGAPAPGGRRVPWLGRGARGRVPDALPPRRRAGGGRGEEGGEGERGAAGRTRRGRRGRATEVG